MEIVYVGLAILGIIWILVRRGSKGSDDSKPPEVIIPQRRERPSARVIRGDQSNGALRKREGEEPYVPRPRNNGEP